MAKEKKYTTYQEFWPFYVSQHLNPICRWLHFVGTALVFVLLFIGIAFAPVYLVALPIVGYGFAWVGHFVFEKNRPATFTYPTWSLIADFQMFFLILLGKMPKHLDYAKNHFKAK